MLPKIETLEVTQTTALPLRDAAQMQNVSTLSELLKLWRAGRVLAWYKRPTKGDYLVVVKD